jgi:hypothetical protein
MFTTSMRGHRGIDLISDAPPFGGFVARPSLTQSAMQSATQSFTVAHKML